MTNVSIINTSGKQIIFNRAFKAVPDYTVPVDIKLGVDQSTVSISTTSLDYPIPVANGTVNDNGDNQLTGSLGGDNSTDNSTTYKEGAGATDAKAQNLITTGSNVSKVWTIANLAALGTNITGTNPFGLWLYIKDAAALAKFKSTSTALEIRLGSDTSNYYSKTYTAAELSTGWNWITSNTTATNALTMTGTVSGNIDTFQIIITTNNAADAFVAGDVVYDLLRQWATADLLLDLDSGYPTLDETNREAVRQYTLTADKGNGFPISGLLEQNTDSTIKSYSVTSQTDDSKSSTDQFIFVFKDRIL